MKMIAMAGVFSCGLYSAADAKTLEYHFDVTLSDLTFDIVTYYDPASDESGKIRNYRPVGVFESDYPSDFLGTTFIGDTVSGFLSIAPAESREPQITFTIGAYRWPGTKDAIVSSDKGSISIESYSYDHIFRMRLGKTGGGIYFAHDMDGYFIDDEFHAADEASYYGVESYYSITNVKKVGDLPGCGPSGGVPRKCDPLAQFRCRRPSSFSDPAQLASAQSPTGAL